MAHKIIKIDNNSEWLKTRSKGLGGSDAACIMVLNPFKTNLELWREKTGRAEPKDVSNYDAVKYGKDAEEPLRKIFLLDYPQYVLEYRPFDIHCNTEYEFIRGTFDGELFDTGQFMLKGIYEGKTGEIRQSTDWLKWKNKVPQNYFCQILHYFAIDPEYKYCKLKAQLKHYDENDEVLHTTKHYHFNREDYEEDIKLLIQEEVKFWDYVEKDKEPPLKLPQI